MVSWCPTTHALEADRPQDCDDESGAFSAALRPMTTRRPCTRSRRGAAAPIWSNFLASATLPEELSRPSSLAMIVMVYTAADDDTTAGDGGDRVGSDQHGDDNDDEEDVMGYLRARRPRDTQHIQTLGIVESSQ